MICASEGMKFLMESLGNLVEWKASPKDFVTVKRPSIKAIYHDTGEVLWIKKLTSIHQSHLNIHEGKLFMNTLSIVELKQCCTCYPQTTLQYTLANVKPAGT